MRLKYIHECNRAKKHYYSDLIVDCGNDQRRLFRVISKLTKGDSKSIFPDEISFDLCNNFNDFFVNKVNNLREKIDSINNIENISGLDIYRDMNPSYPGFTEFKCVSKEHILKLISSSKPTTCALDPLPTPLFKTLASILIDPLYELINKSLTEGVFPSYWKTSIVTPIIKKPSLPACYPNYRPVSNLSFASKILEKVVIEQFTDHLISNNLFSNENSAYKKYHSTETLLCKMKADSIDKQHVSILLLIDLSAAFDTVDFNVISLIFKQNFNIDGTVLNWFETYLLNRRQNVKINSFKSNEKFLKYGGPQGSCFGPIIFLSYLKSLYDLIRKHLPSVSGYADDNQIYISFKPDISQNRAIEALQSCIGEVRCWFLSHKLLINDSKTEILLIGTRQQLRKLGDISVSVGGISINPTDKVCNLGFILDENLTLNKQISNVCRKSHYHLTRIRHIRPYLTVEVTEKLIHAFVSSSIDYCNSLYYEISDYNIKKLQVIQNCAARLVLNVPPRSHVTLLLKQLHWLPVKFRIEYKICLITYNCLNNLAPKYLADLITRYTPARQLRSNNKNLLKVPKIKLEQGRQSFAYAAPKLWNRLPSDVRDCLSLAAFKKKLKTYYFHNAFPF